MNNDERRLVAGGFIDFLSFLASSPNPIITGEDYPRERLMKAFSQWATRNNFDTTDADSASWKDACNRGFMKRKKHDALSNT